MNISNCDKSRKIIYSLALKLKNLMTGRPRFIALKAISDFADSKKGDQYHKYASYTSAKVFQVLATRYFEYEE